MPPTIATSLNYSEQHPGSHILAVDLDGDGTPELVAPTYGDNQSQIEILHAGANGRLTVTAQLPLGTNPGVVATGDLNRDGWPDLVATDPDANKIHVSLNDGHGGFPAALRQDITLSSGSLPTAVAVGDLNGDGWPDIVVVEGQHGAVDALLADGHGNFVLASSTVIFAHSIAYAAPPLALADVTGDGVLDVVVANSTDGFLDVLTGVGDGTFTGPTGQQPSFDITALAVGDFNGDGAVDVAVASNTVGLAVLMNLGGGTFAPPSTQAGPGQAGTLLYTDVDGDCVPDLVSTNSGAPAVVWFRGHTDGSFESGLTLSLPQAPACLAVDDLDHDGRVDFATCSPHALTVSTSTATPALWDTVAELPIVGASTLAVGDVTGDGYDDIVVVTTGANLVLLVGEPDGGFAGATTFPIPASAATIADFNGDGLQDIAAALRNDGGYTVLLSQGDGGFVAQSSWAPGSPTQLVAGDFNGDGRTDLAYLLGSGYVLAGRGDGTFGVPTSLYTWFTGGWASTFVARGDVNADGRADLVFTGFSYGQTRAFLQLPDGGMASHDSPFSGDEADDIQLVHLAGSTRPVLAMTLHDQSSPVYENLEILASSVATAPFNAYVPSVSVAPNSLGIEGADVDGDGHTDLIVAGGDNKLVDWVPGLFGATFAPAVGTFVSGRASQVAVGDFNHDGKPDLAVLSTNPARVIILFAR